jgi:hypothetical protein
MSELTIKQERFAQKYVELGNASEAYRQAYGVLERLLLSKLAALRKLTQLMPKPSGDQYTVLIAAFKAVLASNTAHYLQRAAAADALAWLSPPKRVRSNPDNGIRRGAASVRRWRNEVIARDGHRCTSCGSTSELHAHHLEGWADRPELRIMVNNGITLCGDCHRDLHQKRRCSHA